MSIPEHNTPEFFGIVPGSEEEQAFLADEISSVVNSSSIDFDSPRVASDTAEAPVDRLDRLRAAGVRIYITPYPVDGYEY